MRNNKILVSIVGSLGIIIVILFGVLGYGLVKRLSDPNFTFFKSDQPSVTATPNVQQGFDAIAETIGDFGEVAVSPPDGATLKGYRIENGRLVLRFEKRAGAGLTSILILMDLKSGARVGTVTLGPSP